MESIFRLFTLIGLLLLCDSQYTLEGSVTVDALHSQTITLRVAPSASTVQITFTGIADEWIGFGFGSHAMPNTYSIVADGVVNGNISEYQLAHNSKGTELASTINVQSNTISNLVRTVILTRDIDGASKPYYSFPTIPTQIQIIWAYGPWNAPVFSQCHRMAGRGESFIDLNYTNNGNITKVQ
eukprot:300447_1